MKRVENAVSQIVQRESWLQELGQEIFREGDFLPGMSRFQIENFVLNQDEFPTPDAVVGQCIRELYTRIQNIAAAEKEWADAQMEIELAEVRRDRFRLKAAQGVEGDPEPNLEMLGLEVRENQALAQLEENKRVFLLRRLQFIEANAKDQVRQTKVFWGAFQAAWAERRCETVEGAERLNWELRSLVRILRTNQPLPPWPPEVAAGLRKLAQEIVSTQMPFECVIEKLEGSEYVPLELDRSSIAGSSA